MTMDDVDRLEGALARLDRQLEIAGGLTPGLHLKFKAVIKPVGALGHPGNDDYPAIGSAAWAVVRASAIWKEELRRNG